MVASAQDDDEDLAQLAQLEREEQALLDQRSIALEAALQHSVRESERCLDAVRRALPELDVVSKTANELRTSIHKTMERADVVSVKVRELDLSRSRALDALQYAKRCQEARQFVRLAKQAVLDKQVEIAAAYVQRFDELAARTSSSSSSGVGSGAREQFGTTGEEMMRIRNELERSILFTHPAATAPHQQQPASPPSSSQALSDNWLESAAIKEALKHANVMSKVAVSSTESSTNGNGGDASAEARYAHFLASFLRERMQLYLAQHKLGEAGGNTRAFVDAFKFLFNSACSLMEAQLAVAGRILSPRARPPIFKAIHHECDKQCTQLFSLFMTARRVHERAAAPASSSPPPRKPHQHQQHPQHGDDGELAKLNQLLTEMCIIMQHVESYDRFTRSLKDVAAADAAGAYQPEYKRAVQEVAGTYTMLERQWLVASLQRAKQAEQVVETTASASSAPGEQQHGHDDGDDDEDQSSSAAATVLRVSSVVEDAFYVSKRAVRRALGTGSSDAACGCINQVVGCLEDALLSSASASASSYAVQVNSLEVAAHYSRELYQQIAQQHIPRTFERADELAKTRTAAEALLDLGKQLDQAKVERLRQHVVLPAVQSWWKQPSTSSCTIAESLERATYVLDDKSFSPAHTSEYVDRLLGQIHLLLARLGGAGAGELSETSLQLVCELAAQRLAEDVERGVVVKHYSQLGALQLDHDVRTVADGLCQLAAITGLPVRAQFARLGQICTLLGISTLGEAHDVWDSFAHQQQRRAAQQQQQGAVRPRAALTVKEAKRILPLRSDFKQKDVDQLKLL